MSECFDGEFGSVFGTIFGGAATLFLELLTALGEVFGEIASLINELGTFFSEVGKGVEKFFCFFIFC